MVVHLAGIEGSCEAGVWLQVVQRGGLSSGTSERGQQTRGRREREGNKGGWIMHMSWCKVWRVKAQWCMYVCICTYVKCQHQENDKNNNRSGGFSDRRSGVRLSVSQRMRGVGVQHEGEEETETESTGGNPRGQQSHVEEQKKDRRESMGVGVGMGEEG